MKKATRLVTLAAVAGAIIAAPLIGAASANAVEFGWPGTVNGPLPACGDSGMIGNPGGANGPIDCYDPATGAIHRG